MSEAIKDTTMKDTPSQDIDIEELYNFVTPQAPQSASVAKWLVPILMHHKTRIINLTRNAELGKLSAQKLQTDLEAKKYPGFVENIKPLKALEEYPGLQEVWDNILIKYKTEITQSVNLLL